MDELKAASNKIKKLKKKQKKNFVQAVAATRPILDRKSQIANISAQSSQFGKRLARLMTRTIGVMIASNYANAMVNQDIDVGEGANLDVRLIMGFATKLAKVRLLKMLTREMGLAKSTAEMIISNYINIEFPAYRNVPAQSNVNLEQVLKQLSQGPRRAKENKMNVKEKAQNYIFRRSASEKVYQNKEKRRQEEKAKAW